MKVLGRGRRKEVEVHGVPGHVAERRESMYSTDGPYTLMRWRHVGAEGVGCGRNVWGRCSKSSTSPGVGGFVYSGQPESRSEHKFGGTSVDIRFECRPNSEKDDRKVINPMLAVGMRYEGGF